MRLFSQSFAGENFACRVVNYLLQRSPELREGLIRALNSKVSAVWLASESHFSCTCEWVAKPEDADADKGRVDLLIELDSAVVGIEAKLNAVIGADQPAKYVAAVARHAQLLGTLRASSIASVLVMLIPAGRLLLSERHERPVGLVWFCEPEHRP